MKRFQWGAMLLLGIVFCTAIAAAEARAKYVFLFIGDGMGPGIRAYYNQEVPDNNLARFAISVPTSTLNYEGKITDSAAAGTAIACGVKTGNGEVGLNPDNRPLTSVAKLFRDRNYAVGIVTSVGLNDATPGGFYGNRPTRKDYAGLLSDLQASDFDFFAGGALLLPEGLSDKEFDKLMKPAGYTVVRELKFDAQAPQKKVIYLASMAPDWPDAPQPRHLLGEVTKFAAETLSQNPEGFFLMVEGGAIDHDAHANDLAGVMREMKEFDLAVGVGLEFMKQHPEDTLVVVTSDHDTGGLDLTTPGRPAFWARQGQSQILLARELSAKLKQGGPDAEIPEWLAQKFGLDVLTAEERQSLSDALTALRQAGNTKPPEYRSMYGSYHPLIVAAMRIRDARHGIHWNTFSHSERPVITNAAGVGQANFAAIRENTEIAPAITRSAFGEDLMAQSATDRPLPPAPGVEDYYNFIAAAPDALTFRYGRADASAPLVLKLTDAEGKPTASETRADRAGRVVFANLKPGTEYQLEILTGDRPTAKVKARTPDAPAGKKLCRFGVIADPHISLKPDVRYGRLHSQSATALALAAQELARSGAEFILLPGDVTDASRSEELKAAAKALQTVKLPDYAVPGNHDRLQDPKLAALWQQYFGAPARLEKHAGVQLLALDTGDGKLNQPANRAAIEALDPALPVIVFTHYQLAPDDQIKDDDKAISDAAESAALLDKLKAMNGFVFVGHKNVATTARLGRMTQLNAPQLTQFPAGYLMADLYDDGLLLRFVPALDEFFDEYGRLRSGRYKQTAKLRDQRSLELWNAFYPADFSAARP